MEEEKVTIWKRKLLRLVAKEAGFTIKDTRILWDAIENIFAYCLENHYDIRIPGFGKLMTKKIKSKYGNGEEGYRMWDGVRKQWYIKKEPIYRTQFYLSPQMAILSKISKKDFEAEEEVQEEDFE